jgi:hypothetical protein
MDNIFAQEITKEFCQVIKCDKCSQENIRNLLRDDKKNVPQPGFVGEYYDTTRILFIERNPGHPKNLTIEDKYNKGLRQLVNSTEKLLFFNGIYKPIYKSFENYLINGQKKEIKKIIDSLGIDLGHIAHFNKARCRTKDCKTPTDKMFENCEDHLRNFIDLLEPKVVIFIGKEVSDKTRGIIDKYKIPNNFLNRCRSLNLEERDKNVDDIILFISKIIPDISQHPTELNVSEIEKYHEGAKKKIVVNAYERNKKARAECIELYGYNCQACGINFREKYGDIGSGFIHVHHFFPIEKIGNEYQIDPKKDLCPVCPNCHNMIHKMKDPPDSIDKLKNLFKEMPVN